MAKEVIGGRLGTASSHQIGSSGTVHGQQQQPIYNPIEVQSFSPKPKKKSKFEFIDKLIEESKERLIGHAQPQFAFKYF